MSESVTMPGTENRETLSQLSTTLPLLLAQVGGGGLVAGLLLELIFGGGFQGFLFRYLVAWCVPLTISLGALFFVLIQHLTKAGWSAGLRRIAEILSMGLFPLAVLFLPVLLSVILGSDLLFLWNNAELVAQDHLLAGKSGYLSIGFFTIRVLVYFGAWCYLANYFFRTSVKQDLLGNPSLTTQMEAVSAPGTLVFSLTISFAAFDWLMSLDPYWYSTIFGIYFFAGCLVGFYAAIILCVMELQKRGKIQSIPNVEHYHDLGKLLFAFTCFWAYIAFSQYFLIWYANIPEETGWFLKRRTPAWMWFSIALAVGHFGIPFVLLMSRHVKRNRMLLYFWAAWMLFMHWVDLYWQVLPEYCARAKITMFPISLTDPLLLVSLFALWGAGIWKLTQDVNLVAVADPRLPESLAFKNV